MPFSYACLLGRSGWPKGLAQAVSGRLVSEVEWHQVQVNGCHGIPSWSRSQCQCAGGGSVLWPTMELGVVYDNNWYLLCSILFTLAVTFSSWTVYRQGLAKLFAFPSSAAVLTGRQQTAPIPRAQREAGRLHLRFWNLGNGSRLWRSVMIIPRWFWQSFLSFSFLSNLY